MKKLITLFCLLATISFSCSPAFAAVGVKKATLINPKTGYYQVVTVGSQQAQHFFGLGYQLYKAGNLGFNVITNYKTVLSRQITSNASILYVSSLQTKDGHTIVNADTNGIFYITVEPGLSSEEIVLCTNASSTITAFTGCTRGLAYYGTSTASVTANRYVHQAGSTIIMSNVNYTLIQYVDKDSAQTVTGNKTFTGSNIFTNNIVAPSISGMTLPTSGQTGNAATVGYVNNVAFLGAPNASITVKGVVQIASSSSFAVGTANGSTGAALVIPSSAVASTTASKTMIPATKSNGKLSSGFIDSTANYNFSNLYISSTTVTNLNVTSSSTFSYLPVVSTSTPIKKGQVVALNNSAKLPAIDGSNLTGIITGSYAIVGGTNSLLFSRSSLNILIGYSSYTKIVDETYNEQAGTITTSITLYKGSGGQIWARIYKNGSAFGTERTYSNSGNQTWTEDLSFSKGDLIQLYVYASGNSGTVSFSATCNKFLVPIAVTQNL